MNKVKILPLSLLDKCIGAKLWVVMKSKRQFSGVLRGFDDFFNMVLQQTTQIWQQNGEKKSRKSQTILLNGHDIMVPGQDPIMKTQRKKIEVKQNK